MNDRLQPPRNEVGWKPSLGGPFSGVPIDRFRRESVDTHGDVLGETAIRRPLGMKVF
jgi:hypothetical protein